VRVAIIGAGWIAAGTRCDDRRLEGVDLVGVCDIDEDRARELAGAADVYTDWHELLERETPDAVFVCTPPLLHRAAAVEALDRGIHVYLEKADRARVGGRPRDRRRGCAERRRVRIGYQWRAVEVLDALREALDGQELGLMIASAPARRRAVRGS